MFYIQDKTLTCSGCGQQFTFTGSEQSAFAKKGFKEPGRCAFCRAAEKIASGAGNLAPANRSDQALYPAVCAECGKQTNVPFEPRWGRPVYCRDCYQDHRDSSGGYGRSRSRTGPYAHR